MRIAPSHTTSPRRAVARGAAVLALLLPASALAATPAGDGPRDGAGGHAAGTDGSATEVAALIIGMQVGRTVEPPAPVNPVAAPVDYGTAINGFGNERGRPHEGQDMFAPEGTPLVSPTATEVLETGSDSGRGNWAALYDPEAGRTYVYLHMSAPAAVAAGDRLEPGDRVGLLGCSGSCDGPHLHFETRSGRSPYAPAVDPMPDLQRWRPVR
ncbi:MAG: M23 family metallopeptidase [Thermoleophilia bacterium]|nr:M23 family metallopeptidase [Thermoleophilia bacterium]